MQSYSLSGWFTLWAFIALLSPLGAQSPEPVEDESPEILASKPAEEVLFDTPPAIETASLYAQTLKDAPASVTVITEKQIRQGGYRTLAEALSGVRGFFFTSEGYLQYAGVRGFGLPGDVNTRILVMVNGHNMTDDVYGAMYLFGEDFGIDMDLVQRIEVVRGPTSALYGSNGLFATINIFTRTPSDSAPMTVSATYGSFGEKKLQASASMYLGGGINLLLSLSGFHSTGREITGAAFGAFPGGSTGNVGAERGYHTFAQLTYRNWNFMANFSDRTMLTPIGIFKTDFGDPGTKVRNAHNFVEASWNREIGKASSVRLRISYDQFRYFGRFDYADDKGGVDDVRDEALGDWVGSQAHFRTRLRHVGTLTVGGQVTADLRNLQRTFFAQTPYPLIRDTSQRNATAGVFVQQEWNLTHKLTIYAGLRFDDTKQQKSFLSPRLALVYKPSVRSSYKLMYGRAFRNPSTYEKYWEPNPLLAAERMKTYEFSVEHSIGKRLELTVTAFHYLLDGMIEGVAVDESILQYRNVSRSQSTGAEAEVQGQVNEWLRLSASFTTQRTRYTNPTRVLPNSPAELANFSGAFPLFNKRLDVSTAARYMSGRQTAYGAPTGSVTLVDLTITTQHLSPTLNLQFGLRNLTGAVYGDPVSQEHLLAIMPQAGRAFFIKVIQQREH